MDKVEIFKMVDEEDLILEIDICTASKHTSCLQQVSKLYGIDGFKKIFFAGSGNRFVVDGKEPGEYFELEHPILKEEEIEIIICKKNKIQVHKVPAQVDKIGGYLTFEVYKDLVKTDKYYVETITF